MTKFTISFGLDSAIGDLAFYEGLFREVRADFIVGLEPIEVVFEIGFKNATAILVVEAEDLRGLFDLLPNAHLFRWVNVQRMA